MATFDLSAFPLVVSHWSTAMDSDEVNDYFDQLDRVIDRAQREGVRYVSVSCGGSNLTAAMRKVVAERASKIPTARAALNIASFVVLDNALLRGAVTAIKWISSKNMQNVFPVATLEEGLAKAKSALAAQAALQ